MALKTTITVYQTLTPRASLAAVRNDSHEAPYLGVKFCQEIMINVNLALFPHPHPHPPKKKKKKNNDKYIDKSEVVTNLLIPS